MIRIATIFALLLGLCSTGWADERTQKAIDARQGLLKVVAQYFGPIVGMARGQIPYDPALIENNAGKVAQLAPMIPDLFAMDTSASSLASDAKAEIWADYADFSAKAATTTERANALVAATAEGQGATMKAFAALGASCKNCHESYRRK
ncbi:MAG: cytochrome c [Proteobacteria bacterium]|nr:cytochrome c [Pseudomonadota bacterium]